MVVPALQKYLVGKYVVGKKLRRQSKYPLVLMLEPLFRCNLACAGCGKIDYPDEILNRRLSFDECMDAVDTSGVPVVSIAGGEPLVHPEMPKIVAGFVGRKKFVYLCTNALLLEKNLEHYKPSVFLTFSIHLDGLREEHDRAVCREGVFDKAVQAIKAARDKGFRVTINCTLFEGAEVERTTEFIDFAMELGVEGVTISPGFNYEHAPHQDVFLKRQQSKQLFRDVFRAGREKNRNWRFNQSSLFLDFLAGNQTYQCTPWGNPTRNIFGWQKPCYLMAEEGYASTFQALMEETPWEKYGVGRHEKCAQCQVHCGFEPTAVNDTFANPLKALRVAMRGPRLDGPFATDIGELETPPESMPQVEIKSPSSAVDNSSVASMASAVDNSSVASVRSAE